MADEESAPIARLQGSGRADFDRADAVHTVTVRRVNQRFIAADAQELGRQIDQVRTAPPDSLGLGIDRQLGDQCPFRYTVPPVGSRCSSRPQPSVGSSARSNPIRSHRPWREPLDDDQRIGRLVIARRCSVPAQRPFGRRRIRCCGSAAARPPGHPSRPGSAWQERRGKPRCGRPRTAGQAARSFQRYLRARSSRSSAQ